MKSNAKRLFITFVILSTSWIIAQARFFSAVVDFELLLNTQGEVVKTLENYIELEKRRLEKVRRFAEEYDKLYKSAIGNVDRFLSHPVNAYLLVKRLTTDWKFVLNLVEGYESKAVVYDVTKKEIFPNKDDLGEAVNAVIRLQDTYLLNTTKLAKGEVAGRKGSTELTASDCFELGINAFSGYDFNRSVTWFQETLNRLDGDEFEMVNRSVLLDSLSFSAFSLGDLQRAMELTLDLIVTDPGHPKAHQNLKFYQYKLREEAGKKVGCNKKICNKIETGKKKASNENMDPMLIEVERYRKLCRGEHLRSPAQERKLSCRYTTNGSKYLLLQPVKEETHYLDPWIVVYHDVIRDNDIELLKKISEPKLKRVTVLNPKKESDIAKYRVSKSGWLADKDHPRVEHISFLIEDITGLDTDTAELLQMNKYGLGGHFERHYDFTRPGEFDSFAKFGNGNRIATWLFYLSDVEAGGSTVFTELDIEVKPIKGSAVFWFNLLKSGTGDLRTKHAACPVLAGTKWVANKWFHEKKQEFRRPCSLNPLE